MPRLIDADAYKRVLEGWLADMQSTEEHAEREAILSCICQLDAMQTVDALPVVRCSECVYHNDCGTHFCDRLGMDLDGLNFSCSYGKKEETDHE